MDQLKNNRIDDSELDGVIGGISLFGRKDDNMNLPKAKCTHCGETFRYDPRKRPIKCTACGKDVLVSGSSVRA